MKHHDAGKGSAPRKQADDVAYGENYTRIFGDSGPLARKKRREAIDELVRLGEEMGLCENFEKTS